MDYKYKITKRILEVITQQHVTRGDLKKAVSKWWVDPRRAGKRNCRLTKEGYETLLNKADVKFFEIGLSENFYISNRLLLLMNKYIICPYYITGTTSIDYSTPIPKIVPIILFVTDEKIAVQLILFSGDLYKFCKSKLDSDKNEISFQNEN